MRGQNHDQTTLLARELAIGYADHVVAKGINFDLHQGELMAIVGINGIGKSTLLRTLGNVQSKISGTIEINEKSLEKLPPKELALEISMVLTEPVASKNLTVFELVALGRQPYTNWLGSLTKEDREKINHALLILELLPLKNQKCFELSDGQLQRVMIARAFAQDTSLILLDEPTTHLDLYHKVKILKLLKSISRQTLKTIVFTSHEIELAIQLCDSMLLLDGIENPFGPPCTLIEQKAFDQLFPSDTVSFDANTGSFRIEK
ncbi:MAG: ABC transporter ATP-binding protein [Flavobacteriales bacterium]|nr:MAG: ABC transporter ATP-binding protein [Flavobacteriales bacterium]